MRGIVGMESARYKKHEMPGDGEHRRTGVRFADEKRSGLVLLKLALVLSMVSMCLLAGTPASSAIKFKWEIGTIHSVPDCDGFLDDSDPYVVIRVGSAGATDYFSTTNEGCEGDCALNQVLTDLTVAGAVDVVRVHVRDKDSNFDSWTTCDGDCDSNMGGITLGTVYDDKTWRNSGGTNTGYADGNNGDGDDSCPGSTNFDSRSWYYDTTAPSAPSSITVTEAGNIYQSRASTTASWGAATDADSGIYSYEYCIGTSVGACDVVGWTSNGTSTNKTVTYSFTATGKYYWSVRATNNNGSTFPKQLRDSGGDTANYHITGTAINDSTGFTIDATGPSITERENISVTLDYDSGGSWSGWVNFPPAGTPGYVREPTYARVYLTNRERNGSSLGSDEFAFSQGAGWNSGCGVLCSVCMSGNDWSPWDTDSRIGVNCWDSSNGCEGPEYNATVVEFEKSYGWYSADPGSTVKILFDSNSATTSADDSSRANMGDVYVQQDCSGGWTSVWSGTSDTVSTFNPWSTAVDGEHKYCIRGCDTVGNCKETFDGETIKVSFWYRKDTTAPTAGTVTYADGYRTVTNVAVSFTNGTDAQSGVAHNYIERAEATLSYNTCGSYSAWGVVATDPIGASWTDSSLITGTCYKYRQKTVDNVGWTSYGTSASVVKVDTSSPVSGSIAYADGYNTTGSATFTLANGSDAQSDLANRYLQRKEVALSDDTCGDFGSVSWSTRFTNPTTPTQADAVTSGKCYMYQFIVDNNAALSTTYTSANVIKVDTSAPNIGGGAVTTTPEYLSGSTWYVISPFVASMSDSDPESGFAAPPSAGCQYTIDGSSWSNADNLCSHQITCADGVLLHINMKATNRAGLTSTGTSKDRVCDSIDPFTNINWVDDWTNVSPISITLTPVDSGAGIAATYYCVDTTDTCTPATTYTVPFNVTCAAGAVCTKYVRYYSVDNVGNTEDLRSTRVRQDRENPSTADDWDDNCAGTASPQSPVTVNLTMNDGIGSGTSGGSAKTEYCVDTTNTCTPSVTGNAAPAYCAYLSSCQQYVRYRSTDYAGNTGAIGTACVKQNIQPPNWLDQWDQVDDVSGGATDITPTDENTVYTHGPHSLNTYDAPGAQTQDYYDWFRINMTANKRYCFNSIGGIGDAYARFYDSAMTQLVTDDNSGGTQQFAFCYTPAASGWHYLRLEESGNDSTYYGDIHYWYTTVNAAPAATANSTDQAYVRITNANDVRCDCDNWPSGDTDFQLRGYIGGTQLLDSTRKNDSCGNVAFDTSGTKDISRTENPNLRVWITDEDGGLCEGWSCEDTLTNTTYNDFSAVGGAGWHWVTQDNANCDACYDDVNVNFASVELRDRGVDAPGGLSVTSTDTGTNAKTRFSWNAVTDRSGIDDYWFVLDDNSDFSSPIISKTVGASLYIDVGYGLFTHGTTYYWKVAARSTCASAAPKVCSGGSPHVNFTSSSFTFSDDDTTQPNAGSFTYKSNIFDSTTNYSIIIEGSAHTRIGDDQNESNECIAFGRKVCSDFYPTEPSVGSNSYLWNSGDRNADAATVPTVEIDTKTVARTGGQVYWNLQDFCLLGNESDIMDGSADFAAVTLPQVTADSVNRPGKDAFFYLDRMVVKLTLQTKIAERCSIIWPFSCTPNQSEPVLNIQTNRYDGAAWGGWTTRLTVSGAHDWTSREYTLLDTTNVGTIAAWNNGANQFDIKTLLNGPMGANMIETEYEEVGMRTARVEATYYWHINSHSAVQFVPLTEILGTPITYNCLMEDADNDRGANKDCSPGVSLDSDYDCVQGGGQNRSGSCTPLSYTVADDDTNPPNITFDAPSCKNAAFQLEASASDMTEGDEPGVKYVKFEYSAYSGGCGASWTLIGQDTDTTMGDTQVGDGPDCDPIYCLNWSSLPASDGRYCVRATTEDDDDDRANDSLTASAIDDNVMIDRQPPNVPTIASVKVDNGSCTGAALPDNTWQGTSSDPCFTWNAPADPGGSGVVDYWVYYGTKCAGVVDADGGWLGSTTTSWTNDVSPGEGTFCFWMKAKDCPGNQSAITKLYTIKYDITPPSAGTVTPANTDYAGTYLDGTFDVSTTFTDAASGVASCQYCKMTSTPCSTWSAGTWSAGSCSVNSLNCNNGDVVRLNMRATDNAGITGTATEVSRTCDTVVPTCSISNITESIANAYYPGAGTLLYYGNASSGGNFSVTVTSTDTGGSGVQKVNFPSPNNLTGCGDDASSPYTCSFSFTTSTTQSGAVTETAYDNVDNTNTCSFTLTRDITAPAGGSIIYTDGWYNGTDVSVTFTNGTDSGSGIASRVLQVQSATIDGSGNCGAFGGWGNVATNPASPYTYPGAAGNCYKFQYLEYDNVNNVATYTSTSVARISGGAYLQISQFDANAADDPEGILAPDNTDYEEVAIKLLNENDATITQGALASKSVTLTLGNLGATGAYISATNLGSPTCTPGPGVTSCSGNLVSGEAYVRIKANGSEATGAITVTPSSAGLSGVGGRNQIVYLLVRNSSNVNWPGSDSDVISTAGTQLVFNPVWSHGGGSIAYMYYDANGWNIYKKTYSGGAWQAAVKLTANGIGLRPGGGISWSMDATAGDDHYVVFSAKTSVSENDIYTVHADGTDNAKTLAQLSAANQKITNVSDAKRWADSDWSERSCGSRADSLLVSMSNPPSNISADLWRIYGTKTNGAFVESAGGTNAEQITNLPDYVYAIQPRWSHNCSKIVFTAIDGVGYTAKTGIYVIDLTTATLPVSSLGAAGVSLVHQCTTASCPAGPGVFPSFSQDNSMVIYSVDTTSSIDIRGLQNDDVLGQFYTGKNFDNYVTYLGVSPFVTQKVGESANNEFGLTQCYGAACPTGDGKALTYVTQKAGSTTGALRYMFLSNENGVTTSGGLMFLKGAVVAVIPANALHAETKLDVSTPSVPGSPDGKDLLVTTGDAREFFPDGVKFDRDILMIFHYDDADNNGIIDAGSPGAGLDENKIYVYYWCDSGSTVGCAPTNSWIRLDGSIDPSRNTITVATNHFSLYDPKVLVRGLAAPAVLREMYLSNPHTYPNPRHTGDGPIYFNIDADSSFNTQAEGTAGTLNVSIEIFDIRGKRVRTISNTVTGLATLAAAANSSPRGGIDLAMWDATNSAGRPLASGVYLYQMTVSDGIYSRSVTSKLAIVR